MYGFTFKIEDRLPPTEDEGTDVKKDEMVACVCRCSEARPVMACKLGSIFKSKERVASGVNEVEWLIGGKW